MFLPVACLKCGKLFQVAQEAAGAEVPCPWCKEATPALPVAGAIEAPPHPDPPPRSNSPEPLTLDECEPAPRATPAAVAPPGAKILPASPPPPLPGPATAQAIQPSRLRAAALAMLLAVAVAGLTVAVLRYGSGAISPASWVEFTPPDGSCTIALPGSPTSESAAPGSSDGVSSGMQRFTTSGWYSRARVWFGWRDLDPGWVKQAALDRDGSVILPILAAERDRRRQEVKGTITTEATVRFGPDLGLEVWMDTPKGKLVERFLASLGGSHPRLYFMGIEAKNASADGDAARKLFNSFRVN